MSGAPDTWPLSAHDAARIAGVSERTIRRAIARGGLPATKHAGVYFIYIYYLVRYRSRGVDHDIPAPRPVLSALPSLPASLIGRAEECAAARGLVLRNGVRLVTLTGPGGVGKTSLALQIATEIAGVFHDGAFFVDLSAVRDARLVLPGIAQAIGVRHTGQRALEETIVTFLGARELLLVLDNCEQVIEAAPQIAALIAACPALHILATSRIPLRLRSEYRLVVEPLPVPTSALQPADVLAQSDAIRLFLERARAVYPALATTDRDLQTIASICQRLDGLPLAIELAAAWSELLTPQELLAQLSDRMRRPGGGPRDLPDRQRTVWETIAWSYDLLATAEQDLFRHLAVFVDRFDLDAAIAIAGLPSGTALE
nr:protein kinase [Chloroflexia bacterium]